MNDSGNFILWGAVAPVTLVCLAIAVLLVRAMLRAKAQGVAAAGPVQPSAAPEALGRKTWIALAIAAIAIISVPAQRLVTLAKGTPDADVTVEVTGNMWFWTYRYLDGGNFGFSAPMLEDALTGEIRLAGLPEDDADNNNRLVIPVGKNVRLVTRGEAVVYRWSIPALGVLVDALPGRPNETMFSASSVGRYYSEYEALCSASHVFIPIEIEVVSEEKYNQWLSEKQTQISAAGMGTEIR
jgi:cytochrome c oxidase subunit 2